MKRKMASSVLLVALLAAFARGTELDERFKNPPEETKPWCYWYWLDGDISREGITKDLEAMAHVGIKRATIGNIKGGGSMKMFSPEWYDLTRHTLQEANRLAIELMMFNAPGWSQSGGPWIKPEQSMRRVTWEEIPARGGSFSRRVRPAKVPAGQDIAVLAVPRLDAVSINGVPRSSGPIESLSAATASWIWHPSENGASDAPAATRYFRRTFTADPSKLESARIQLTADNSYVLWVNGQEVIKDADWRTQETVSIASCLKPGQNVVAIAVTNTAASAAGLIATIELRDKTNRAEIIVTDKLWLTGNSEVNDWRTAPATPDGWLSAQVLGPINMQPWCLSAEVSAGEVLDFIHPKPFTARALVVHGKLDGKLYAVRNDGRSLVAEIRTGDSNPVTDFLPDGIETFSFAEVTAQKFELEAPGFAGRVELTSEPKVAQVIEKQMGRMHPTPSPTWESYIFPDTCEPAVADTVVKQRDIIDLTNKLAADGVLTCQLPEGDWTVIHFGMVSTGKQNLPAPPEATGLEVDKLSRPHIEYHFNAMFGELLKQLTPEERAAFKGITIDSYEVGAQNWTDGFAAEFERRNGYDPVGLLPVLTGRVVDSAAASDRFLWDLRRTVADMIAENYVGGLRDIAHQHGLTMWCENYGHWGFPGEFMVYGAYADEIGGEFWTNQPLGTIECRAASSSGHVYGKQRIYAEAFTSSLDLGHHPHVLKARGEELFCEGVNHFKLHLYSHQPRDGVPGKNPAFGTAFHRNTPWFNHARDWVKYLQRCHLLLQQGEPLADVAVYIGDFAPQMTGPANPVPMGYDYDYIGSDAILRKLRVVDGQWVVDDEHNPGRIAARWNLLALPKLKHVRPRVLTRLDELKAQGGRVVEAVPVSAKTLQDAAILPLVSDTSCSLRWKARRLNDGIIFFLCNFARTGTFEATLRVGGKVPELFNPVTGRVTRLARFTILAGGTRIAIDVRDPADSCFIVFRDEPTRPSVVAASAGPGELDLFYDRDGQLAAETAATGSWKLTLSDGSMRTLVARHNPRMLVIEGPWKTSAKHDGEFTHVRAVEFDLPPDFGKQQRIYLDLGKVRVMARVTLNGKVFDTLWMPPFTLDVTDTVKPGPNALQVLVTSTTAGTPELGVVQLKTAARLSVNE